MEHYLAYCNLVHHRPFEAIIIIINNIRKAHVHAKRNICPRTFILPCTISAQPLCIQLISASPTPFIS